jgi:hypothetical protein
MKGDFELTQVGFFLIVAGTLPGTKKIGRNESGQNTNDRDGDEELDKSKAMKSFYF